jgi:hypothetical protein
MREEECSTEIEKKGRKKGKKEEQMEQTEKRIQNDIQNTKNGCPYAYGQWSLSQPAFFTSALHESQLSAPRPGRFNPDSHWVGIRSGLDKGAKHLERLLNVVLMSTLYSSGHFTTIFQMKTLRIVEYNGKIITNLEEDNIRKDTSVACLKTLSSHLSTHTSAKKVYQISR